MQRLPSRRKPGRTASGIKQQTSTDDEHEGERPSSPSAVIVTASSEATDAAYNGDETTEGENLTSSKLDGDVFETATGDEVKPELDEDPTGTFSSGYEELPIEIQSLMERFLESLVTRAQPAPLSVDRLSDLYQDFYDHAHSQIYTHIAALSTKISREASPAPSISSAGSTVSRGMAKRKPPSRRSTAGSQTSDHQMLTASEVTGRRKARRQLEVKRLAMEEAVERGVCEKVYPRLWRHQSTDDEARDEKLRSKAAALAVVGVDLKELLSTALSGDTVLNSALEKSAGSEDTSARDLLGEARESLESMNDERFPLGKLGHLTAAHKAIVEALQQMFPSASSADEVLPTLIYAIITTKPDSSSVISNFNFIQRFRASSRIDGEAAYCLTNLEAAISFLEDVDLSSIRASETPQGPPKSPSNLSSPQTEPADPLYRGLPSSPPTYQPKTPSPAVTRTRPRALSGHLRPFEAASDAVRSGANDIHHALDGGFKFLFGRLKEKQAASSPVGSPKPATPKTLEDARKLVSQEDTVEEDQEVEFDETKYLGQPKGLEAQKLHGFAMAEEALRLINGTTRDRSVDSARSTGSRDSQQRKSSTVAKTTASTADNATYNPVDSFRNIGNVLNPFKGFGGMAMSRSFGRAASNGLPMNSQPLDGSSPAASSKAAMTSSPLAEANGKETAQPASPTPLDWTGIAPPMNRFVQCRDARELNFFDIELLLRDYQRLAGAVEAAMRSDA